MEHIKNIEIKNFKSIRHQTIDDCRRVNVFIGYPNVGKSNILEAIGLLTYIRAKRPTGLNGLVRFEKFTQIFNYFNINEPAFINFNDDYSLIIRYEDESALNLNLINKKEEFGNNYFGGLRLGKSSIHSTQIGGTDIFSGSFIELRDFNVRLYKFSESKDFNKSYSALELSIPFGGNMLEVIINNIEIKKQFQELLEPYHLELIIDRGAEKGSELKISPKKKDGTISTIPISLLADTLVRLIFFKSAIYSSKDSVLLFEEPEAHMFPPYISKFTSDVVYDDRGNQFFIATHSPFVLNDFMEDMDKKDLSVYVVGYKKETGETIIKRISEDEIEEIYQYGVDLFFNLENYLKDAV